MVSKHVQETNIPFLGAFLDHFHLIFSLEILKVFVKNCFDKSVSKVFCKMSFQSYAYSSLHLGSHNEDEMHHTFERKFPLFGEDISAISYIAWEREVDDLVHSFHPTYRKYYIRSLCIFKFHRTCKRVVGL